MGMNAGILDARNLAWKLDLTLHALAGPDLLPSYENEFYLIRPDRTAGFRSLPTRWDALRNYLTRVFEL